MVRQRVKTYTIPGLGPVIPGGPTGPEWTAAEAITSDIATLTEGQILQGAVGGGQEKVKHRAHTSVTIAPSDAPSWQRRIADYEGTAAGIQDAIDEAQTAVAASNGLLPNIPLNFLPGVYSITDEIEAKSASWICPGGAAAGAQVYWDGADGGTMITKTTTDPGTSSWWDFDGFTLFEGTGTPAALLDLQGSSGVGIDSHCYLHNSAFKGGTVCLLLPNGFTNIHWDHIRFDAWWNYAIDLTIPATQFLSNMVLDQFTFDSNELMSAGNAKAFMAVRLTSGGVDPGNITLSNAKFEVNYPQATGGSDPNSIVHVINGGFSAQSPVIHFQNCALTYDNSLTIPPPQSWIHRDTAATGGIDRGQWTNVVSQNATTKMVTGEAETGDWRSPALPAYTANALLNLYTLREYTNGDYAEIERSTFASDIAGKATPSYNGASQCYERTLNGYVRSGSEFTGLDTGYGRVAAGRFGFTSGTTLRLPSGNTASRPSSPANGDQYADTTLNKLITYIGGAWRDGSGASV